MTRTMCTAVLLASLVGTAHADVPARARSLADRGLALHAAGNYDAAVAAFTEAYALAPAPALLFDLAQAYRLGGHCDDAAVMYRRFLGTSPDAEARTLAESHLSAMDRCAAVAVAATPATPLAVTAAAPAPRRGRVARDLGIGLVGGGALSFGVATLYGFRAHDAAEAVSSAYMQGGAWGSLRATDARGQHDATVSEAAAVTGVAAIGAGIALYYLGARESRVVAVVPRAGGAEVHASWRW